MKKVFSILLVLLIFVTCLCLTASASSNDLSPELIHVNEQVHGVFDPQNDGHEREYVFIAPEDGYILLEYSVDLEDAVWDLNMMPYHKLVGLSLRTTTDRRDIYRYYVDYDTPNDTQNRFHRVGVKQGIEYSVVINDTPTNGLISAVDFSFAVMFTEHDSWLSEPRSLYPDGHPIKLNQPVYAELNKKGYDTVVTVLELEEDTEVIISLEWPQGVNEDIDIDHIEHNMYRLLYVYHELGTPESYKYQPVNFGEGEILTLKKGKNYFELCFYDWMTSSHEYEFIPDIYKFMVSEVNPDVTFTAQGYSDGLIYDVTVEGSIPNQYPDGITSLTNSEIQSLPVTIHTRNLLNGAVREMGPSTIEMFKVTTVNGKIESIEIRGRAQTNPGTFDRYTVIYTVS